eukprot:364743-Chlamydomonas_euryale.AAC.87
MKFNLAWYPGSDCGMAGASHQTPDKQTCTSAACAPRQCSQRISVPNPRHGQEAGWHPLPYRADMCGGGGPKLCSLSMQHGSCALAMSDEPLFKQLVCADRLVRLGKVAGLQAVVHVVKQGCRSVVPRTLLLACWTGWYGVVQDRTGRCAL